MDFYSMYLDEANVAPKNPYFCLGGIIVKRSIYEDQMIDDINELKKKHFADTSIIFHYTEMKKNKGTFQVLKDGAIRTNFWNDFNNTLRNIDFTTLGVYIEMDKFKEIYNFKNNRHYEYAFVHIVNNFILFLKANKGMGNIIVESRQWIENADIQEVFQHILNCGTDIYSSEECKKYLSTIGFITKKDNCVGLQIADFVPDTIVRHLTGARNYHNTNSTFIDKIFSINGNHKDTVGIMKL